MLDTKTCWDTRKYEEADKAAVDAAKRREQSSISRLFIRIGTQSLRRRLKKIGTISGKVRMRKCKK